MKLKMIVIKLFKRKSTVICASFILLVVIAAIFAPFFAPHDPTAINLNQKFLGISTEYPMGTDDMGRCVFSRILYGARSTLGYAIFCTVASAIIGTTLGILAGYHGGVIDQVIMRLCDILYAFPNLVLVLVIVSFFGPGIFNVIIAMLMFQWLWYARVSRNLAQSEKECNYIAGAKLSGASGLKILFKHIYPNIFPQMLALITIDFGHTILSISGFSFLGLGVQPPAAEWGVMINDGRGFINSDPMLMFWPGIMILLVVISANIIGDNLRDTLDRSA